MSSAESFSQQWSTSVASLSSSLERNDALRVSLVKSFEDVQRLFPAMQVSLLSGAAVQELTELAHALDTLHEFMDFVSNQAKPPTDTSIFWGLVGLVIHLSHSEIGVAPRVPRMLRGICQNIDLLYKYRDKELKTLPEIRDSCFRIANVLLHFLVAAINFIREDVDYFANDGNVWEPLQRQFRSCCSEIDGAVSHLEKMCRLSGLDDLSQLQSALATSPPPRQSSDEAACLPCFIYPNSRTPRFFDRTDDIIKIDRYFDNAAQNVSQPFRSLVLHGIGGIGKSSVALRYAESRIRSEELDAMLWISGEKTATIRQSFTDIAMRLKLPGANPKDDDLNRTLVLDWIQNTSCKWLLVFDNVEDVDLLMRYWPAASRGQAVITTRNHSLAFYPCDGGLEIKEWDTDTGSQFLLHLLSTDIGHQLTEDEAHSAQELARSLSGHALAISLMAGLIHRRSWSIKEFVELYKRQPQKVHGIFGNNSINALWDMSFRNLNERSRAILGVLAFLTPDSIPQALFEPKDTSNCPDSLSFCKDSFDFSDEIETLMTLALVKRNKEKRAFSIHRLVQASFRHFMSYEDRQRSFNDATLLVSAAFPRKDAEFAQLYHSWQACSLYLPHVLSLRDCFREEKKSNSKFSALMEYCSLNNACQRFLIETNNYNDLLDLLEINSMVAATIPPQPLSIHVDLEGELASHRGQALVRVGRADEGIPYLQRSYKMFAMDQPRNLREEAWCAENLADGLASTNNFIEAVRFQETARDHWLDWAKDNSEDKTEWPAILKWGMGTNLIWAGQNEQSRSVLVQGLSQLEATKPYNWAMAAYTNYSLGTVNRSDGDFISAERHFTEAYDKWISGNNLLSDPFCGACVYRIGCAALDQGKVETAIKHLREASCITERHMASMPVEHARSLFKLSEAVAKEPGGGEESGRLREDATRLLLSRSPEAKHTDLEKTYDDLVFIWWR